MKNVKRAVSLLLSLMLLLGSFGVLTVYAEATASWDETTGTLTVSGSGNVTREMVSGAVSDISDIKTVIIGEGITSLGDNAFNGCTGLESVSLPSGLDSIGNSAFYNCVSLTSIIIPSGVSIINDDTFSGCTGLKSVTLPSGLDKIGDRAFYGCSALESIDLPNGLESIGSYAFLSCSKLWQSMPYIMLIQSKYSAGPPPSRASMIRTSVPPGFRHISMLSMVLVP